jgi:hypothetical protein
MKRAFAIAFLAAVGSLAMSACAEPPTEQELDDMCRHLETLRGEIDTTPVIDIAAKIEKDVATRLEAMQKESDAALKAVDDELQAKLATAASDDEKEKLNEEYAPKKDEAAKKFDAQMQALSVERTESIKKAGEKAEADQKALEENIKKCKADKKTADISKTAALCRIKAKTVDEFWNTCK